MGDLDACHAGQGLGEKMHGGASPCCGDSQATGILLRVSHQIGECLDRRVRVHSKDEAVATETGNPREILDRVPINFLHIGIAQQARCRGGNRVAVRIF